MFTKITLTTITIVLLISLAGCGISNQTNPSANAASDNSQIDPIGGNIPTTDADNYQMLPEMSGKVANMKLDANATGTTQQLKQGEVMSINLESNPSTGYAWYATISDSAVLVQMSEPQYIEPTGSATPIVGAAGTQTFFFQAVETGTTTVSLDYKRSWETDVQPLQTITLTVEVQ